MAEDDRLAFNIRCFVMNTVPNRIFLLGVILKCVSVIMRYGAAMNQNVRFAIDLDIDVQRQAVKIVENLLTDGFADMLDVLVGDITAVPVPQSKNVRVFRVVPVQHIEGIEHHILMVAKEHMHIGQAHQQPQNADAVRVSIYDIPEDIECVLWPQIDLLHDGVEPDRIAMDVRHHIGHRSSSSPIC